MTSGHASIAVCGHGTGFAHWVRLRTDGSLALHYLGNMKWMLCFGWSLMLLGGCTAMLPESRMESTPFSSYEDVRAAFQKLEPMKSHKSTLQANGFNPVEHPNTKLLTHSDVVRIFVPSALLQREDLDPGVLACLEARDACHGLEFDAAKISRARVGNFLTDFANFHRRTETTGWRFHGLILFVNDMVVYRSWGGQPRVNEVETTSNPLGPLQDVGPSLLSIK